MEFNIVIALVVIIVLCIIYTVWCCKKKPETLWTVMRTDPRLGFTAPAAGVMHGPIQASPQTCVAIGGKITDAGSETCDIGEVPVDKAPHQIYPVNTPNVGTIYMRAPTFGHCRAMGGYAVGRSSLAGTRDAFVECALGTK